MAKFASADKPNPLNETLARLRETLLTPKQVSELLGVSEITLSHWRCDQPDHLRFVRVSPQRPGRAYRGKIRYRLADVLALIDGAPDAPHGLREECEQ